MTAEIPYLSTHLLVFGGLLGCAHVSMLLTLKRRGPAREGGWGLKCLSLSLAASPLDTAGAAGGSTGASKGWQGRSGRRYPVILGAEYSSVPLLIFFFFFFVLEANLGVGNV